MIVFKNATITDKPWHMFSQYWGNNSNFLDSSQFVKCIQKRNRIIYYKNKNKLLSRESSYFTNKHIKLSDILKG